MNFGWRVINKAQQIWRTIETIAMDYQILAHTHTPPTNAHMHVYTHTLEHAHCLGRRPWISFV